jgi:hypothetical protein
LVHLLIWNSTQKFVVIFGLWQDEVAGRCTGCSAVTFLFGHESCILFSVTDPSTCHRGVGCIYHGNCMRTSWLLFVCRCQCLSKWTADNVILTLV